MIATAIRGAARLPAAALFVSLGLGAASAQEIDLDVPYVPTPARVVDKMLELATVKEGDVVIDLGSGDGRIAIAAAKRGARAYGVDINPVRVKEAVENAQKEGVAERATFREQNLFDTNITQAQVITMYLLPSVNRDLRPRLLDLTPGTRVVSHAFDMGDWLPDERAVVDGKNVYFWKVPAKVDGRWAVEHGGDTVNLILTQTYQRLSGTADMGGKNSPVEGSLDGDLVTLSFGEGEARRELRGRVNGSTLEPIAGSSAGSWTARRG